MDMMYIPELVCRMLLLSGLLLAVYAIFLRRKASYRMCRHTLLAIPLVCLVLPLVQVGLAELSDLREPEQIVLTQTEAEEYFNSKPEESAVSAALQAVAEAKTSVFSLNAFLWAIPAVSVLLLLMMGVQLLILNIRCRRMARRSASVNEHIVRSKEVDTPFTFGGRIYMPDDRMTTTGERIVTMHERAHVELGHTGEGIIMEMMCRLLWFNPFVWIARRELRDVQEFEADRRVLDAGTEILTYQTLLLEETMKECPVFAEGFNRSFVRRRFVEMRSANVRRNSAALRCLTVVTVLGITVLASAGHGDRPVEFRIIDDAAVSGPTVVAETDKKAEIEASESGSQSEAIVSSSTTAPASGEIEKTNNRPTRMGGYPVVYDIPLAKGPDFSPIRMRHTETETHLIFETNVEGDVQLFKFGGPDAYLVDADSGIHYKARRSIPADAWDYFVVTGMSGKLITVTVVFPRLPDNVRTVALYCVDSQLQSDARFAVNGLLKR